MPASSTIKICSIGKVKRNTPNENVKDKDLTARIILKKSLAHALDGIEDYSHIFVIFWLHKIPRTKRTSLKVRPRGRPQLPLTGVFATRTPNRPNPIGLALVELVKRRQSTLWVKGIDAFDGTPVLDIKPYDSWDAVADYRVPEWHAKLDV
jgi:tRNA-Thr(GGU) m(6)t(6)A37 methyltransferase TsaA